MNINIINSNKRERNLTDTQLLQSKIKESGLKTDYIANELGITNRVLNKKIKGKIEFMASEVNKLCNMLRLTDTEITNIFFNE